MALSFDMNTGLIAEEASVVRERIKNNFKLAFNKKGELNTDPETPQGQLIDSISAIEVAKDSEVLLIGNMFNPKVSVGKWQDALGAIYFVDRILQSPTIVICTCKGLYGTTIPAGAIIQTTSGVQLKSLDAVVIPIEQEIDVEFECIESGPIEIAANTCTKIVTVIPGWDTVTNDSAGITGTNEESQSAYEERRYRSVAQNAHGSVAAVEGALWQVDGIRDLLILNNTYDEPITQTSHADKWRGVDITGHSIAVCIVGGDGTAIAETLYNKLNAGCGTCGNTTVTYVSDDEAPNDYKIERPTDVEVYVKVRIRTTSTTPSTVVEDIQAAVVNDASGLDPNSQQLRVSMGSTLYASRFSVCVIKTAKVDDLVGITIGRTSAAADESIVFKANEEPIFSKNHVIVIKES